ncbi:hypothetical protein E4U14_002584 [Claviceps sp. LM454 group G7]|nr:hypothetical protein E4U14_002584 [Claviceps sp. LM454 group G7]
MSHTGENICEAVATVLKGYDIFSSDKIEYFTLDNASTNDKAMVELGRKLGWQDPLHKQIRCLESYYPPRG